MATRALEELLGQIHEALAHDMLTKLKSGDVSAQEWSAIAKFLKDNHIESTIGTDVSAGGSPGELKGILDEIPKFDKSPIRFPDKPPSKQKEA